MSSLNSIDKRQLEKLFEMSSGYVLNFSDATFDNFFVDTVNIDIHAAKYHGQGTSKAKKLREFWRLESDYLVGKVILALVEHVELVASGRWTPTNSIDKALIDQCKAIGNRLLAGKIDLSPLKKAVVVFDARHLDEQVRCIEKSIESDPSLAIGTAKELIETCCRTILAERGKPVAGKPEMPALTKETLKELRLLPENITDHSKGSEVIKRMLSNLASISQGLAEIRNLYGTGHGRDGNADSVTPRHAKLAVGAATTFAIFLFDTHKETMP